MSAIHVCSLARLGETVARSGASHLVTLINVGTPVERPYRYPPIATSFSASVTL